MKLRQFVRRPFTVEGEQVTEENMVEIAKWCLGAVRNGAKDGKEFQDYIAVPVFKPARIRQTMAFVDDYVLKIGNRFKVYTPHAFNLSFMESPEPVVEDTTPRGRFSRMLRFEEGLGQTIDEDFPKSKLWDKKNQQDRH